VTGVRAVDMPATRRTLAALALSIPVLAGVAGCRKEAASSASPSARESASDAAASPAADESITNTQEAGVDEGGIIKTHGDHLVVLRRGRLVSVDLGDDRLTPLSAIDVPPTRGHDAWYDEMLIHGDTIVVVGYSYPQSATEIGLFRIDDAGTLSRVDTYFLRSNDYYSSRNYASRLVGDKLVFYMPHYVGDRIQEEALPAVRGLGRNDDWSRVVAHSEIVPSIGTAQDTLHTLVTCDLAKPEGGCTGRGILGGQGRTFYVSGDAVYVWTSSGVTDANMVGSALYRMPLDGAPMGALHVQGTPIDQFSFKQAQNGELHVALTTYGGGDAMWGAELPHGDMGMVSIPPLAFAKWGARVANREYVDLPEPSGNGTVQNRFVGDTLLYGKGSSWGYAQDGEGTVHAHHTGGEVADTYLHLAHGVDRLEPLGSNALVVGGDRRSLHFTSLDLSERPAVGGHFALEGASQGELRSHGFFFKPDRGGDGMLGLPVRPDGIPGYAHLFEGSAAILYLDVHDLQFSTLGMLAADPRASQSDDCVASCVDWYGNSRPVFYKGRVFALLGYELVEGDISDGRMVERRRIDVSSLIGRTRLHRAQ
jgi:hypothetical protein